jgi:hypothetical protein
MVIIMTRAKKRIEGELHPNLNLQYPALLLMPAVLSFFREGGSSMKLILLLIGLGCAVVFVMMGGKQAAKEVNNTQSQHQA